jgi:hypothetical protein
MTSFDVPSSMEAEASSTRMDAEEVPTNLPVGGILNQNFDQLLTEEMQSLSICERTKVQEEIHGVSNMCPEETPEMVEKALKSMAQHLNNIQLKPIYDQLSPSSYLHTREWKLRFLRCELFDCKKAAMRLIRFTEYMEREYDMEVLQRPLRLSDLQTKSGNRAREVMESFRSGHSQLFPFRDRSGRRIFVTCGNHSLQYDIDIRVSLFLFLLFVFVPCTSHIVLQYKTYEYLFLVAASDTETQQKGVVFIFWTRGNPPAPDKDEISSKYFPACDCHF